MRDRKWNKIIKRIIKENHFLGGHSDNHLQYAAWRTRESLVTTDSLLQDLQRNMDELEKWGVSKEDANYYLPPYEFYNAQNIKDIETFGLEAINYTPGVRTAADYTTPDMSNYKSSGELIDSLFEFEQTEGLVGAIILIHPGTVPERTDKLYYRLGEIIEYLKLKGYIFTRF